MVRNRDFVDLYSDDGKLIAEKVPIKALSPVYNPAIKKIVSSMKRTVLVNLRKLQDGLATGKLSSEMMMGEENALLGREMKLDIVGNAEALVKKAKDLIQTKPNDDTRIEMIDGGELLLCQIPTVRMETSADYMTATMTVGNAFLQALTEVFNLKDPLADNWDVLRAAMYGRYPQSLTIKGAISSFMAPPATLEGYGAALRSLTSNHIALFVERNAMQAAALSSILEHAAHFEMGDGLGSYEKYHLLGLAYQGLNADNVVYETVEENGKDGTVQTVVHTILGRAIEEGVIRVKETLPSGFKVYTTDDPSLWNAYAAAGLLAATMVNCGAMRALQSVTGVGVFYNELLIYETGLPDVDYGRIHGTCIGLGFYSHAVYGGAPPATFPGHYVLARHPKGFLMPCIAVATCLDAGTQIYTPEALVPIVAKVRKYLPELHRPIQSVAEGALEVRRDLA